MNMSDTCRDYIKRVGETMTSYHGKCLRLDTTLGTPVVVLRFLVDFFYIIHMVFQFRAAIVSLSSQASGRVELFKEMRAIAWRYLFFYFPADVFMILPLPQVLFFAIVSKLNASRVLGATKSLNFIVVFQYVLRFLRICSLLKKATSNSGILAGTAWVNLFLYMLASHVVGAFWYLFSIERNVTCWSEACKNHASVIRSDMDLRSDTKRYICMGAILKVPFFENMEERLLNILYDSLKPILFSEGSYIVREGDPVESTTVSDGTHSSSADLKVGDFCCEELLTWFVDPSASLFIFPTPHVLPVLPPSSEGLLASGHSTHLGFIHGSGGLGEHVIYRELGGAIARKNSEKSLRKEENRLQDSLAEAGGGSPALGSAIYALRFAANALSHVRNPACSNNALEFISLKPPSNPRITLFFTNGLLHLQAFR
ncbi:cyclic nucleotide-gated ion channel 1-like [Pyrus ussuriensis x Pyrus communis]|uniref:Cyclic nucleotide-gated ion channel 1-like n=1 Tax=Pyrus ussuriensis x Pyrus communis TaxID=2448454 RepID=A0A5N5F7L3_9ROSA|nr:cyclic nucleotide-gated ion channel 1-like [Pyrus ussuriensis x Pyrus communis]